MLFHTSEGHRRQRGEGRLGCMLWTAVLIIAIVTAWKMIPVKVDSAELESFMDEQAKFSARRSAPEIKKEILKHARELDLPVEEKWIDVEKSDGNDEISMRVQYTVPIDFYLFTYEWDFDIQVDRNIYIF